MNHRIHAAVIHLFINLFSFSVLLFILLKVWYPAPFFTASGGLEGLKIVAFVDIILGPLLTMVIFTPGKSKRLLMQDIVLIAVLQIGAFVWGVYTIYIQRPVAITFWERSFYTVDAKSITSAGYKIAQLQEFGNKLPVFSYVESELNSDEADKLSTRIKNTGHPPFDFIDIYHPYKDYFEKIAKHNLDITEITNKNGDMKNSLEKLMKNNQLTSHVDLLFIKLNSKYRNTILVFEKEGEYIGYINAPLKK